MPRLTNKNYIHLHHVLKHLWFHVRQIYDYIPLPDQQYLKDYYLPNLDLGDAELLVHRRKISKLHPSLPQRAGRALAKLDQVAAKWEGLSQFDANRLARALIQLSQDSVPRNLT